MFAVSVGMVAPPSPIAVIHMAMSVPKSAPPRSAIITPRRGSDPDLDRFPARKSGAMTTTPITIR